MSFFIVAQKADNFSIEVRSGGGLYTVGPDHAIFFLGKAAHDTWGNFDVKELDEWYDLVDRMEMLLERAAARQLAMLALPTPASPAQPVAVASSTAVLRGMYPQKAHKYTGPTLSPPAPTGLSCSRCNNHNEYAQANQPDGTYMCYGCRA